ncbi:MAG: ABC transporter ATP-binding protein [Acidimicrobiia bacterium]
MPSANDREPLLSIRNLRTTFRTESGVVQAVRNVSWDVYPGEFLGVVGESGSGKSVSMASIMGLVPSPSGKVTADGVFYAGSNLLELPEREMRRIRGREITMIFQDPMTSFNPVKTIGHQIAEAIRVHDRKVSRKAARARTIELLSLVGVPSPETRFAQFPHEYSGGMRQRAMIAMAIANQPKLIIADEPTTALDVTIQAQILDVLSLIRDETDAATILITHDLGLIAEMSDRVLVMYAGKVVETADVFSLFEDPKHPYTLGLLASLPRVDTRLDKLLSIPGQPPSLTSPPQGCAFHPRCDLTRGRLPCRTVEPPLVSVAEEHLTACHFFDEMESEAEAVTELVGIDVRSGGKQ